ncbi:MAG: MFS transporter [Bdellovibrionia bacterium]
MPEKNHYPKVAIAFLMTFLVMLADITIDTLNQSMIFNRLGSDYIGPMNFVKAISVITASMVSTRFSGAGRNRYFIILFLVIIAGMELIAANWIQIHLVGAIVLSVAVEGALLVGFNFLLWPVLSEIFPVLIRKRVFPLIAMGYGVAGVVAGIAIAESLQRFQVPTLAQVFSGLVLLTAVLAFFLLRGVETKIVHIKEEEAEGFFKGIAMFSTLSSRIPFLKVLFGYIVFVWFLFRLSDYQFGLTLQSMAGSEAQFATWLAYFYSIVNVFLVFYQLLFAQKLLVGQGLTRLMLFFPITMAATSLLCLLFSSNWLIILNRAIVNTFLNVIVFGAIALTYNIAPSDTRSRAQATVEGFSSCIATCTAGLVIYLFSHLLPHPVAEIGMKILILTACLLCLWLAFKLGQTYIEAALNNLRSHDRELFINSIQALQEKGHRIAIQRLLQVAVNRHKAYDPEGVSLATHTLAQLKNPELLGSILDRFEGNDLVETLFAINTLQIYYATEIKKDVLLKYRIQQCIEKILITSAIGDDTASMVNATAVRLYFTVARDEDIPRFLESNLSSSDNRVISNTLEGLPQLSSKYSHLYIERFLSHPNHRVQSTAIVELWKVHENKEPLVHALKEMLDDQNPLHLIAGIWAVGRTRAIELLPVLVKLLEADPLPSVRIHLTYALMRFPLKVLRKEPGLSAKVIEDAHHLVLKEMLSVDNPGAARRSCWHASYSHPSHFEGLEDLIVLSTPEYVDFLYRILLQLGPEQQQLLKIVERYQGLSSNPKFIPGSIRTKLSSKAA